MFSYYLRLAWKSIRRNPVLSSLMVLALGLGIGAFMAGMVVTHFYAIEHVEVAYMIAVKRTSLLFGILYGASLFKETGTGTNLVAGIMMVLGVYLIVV